MRKLPCIIFLMAFIFPLICGDAVASGPIFRGEGILNAIEDDGNVIIGEEGYLVGKNVRVFNGEGKPTFLNSMPIPVKVYFEYEYTKIRAAIMVPAIKLIKEIPKEIPQ